MNLIKYATLIALAAVPLLLMGKKSEDLSQDGREVESEEIFDLELR
jgi:hypothetical protein